MGFKNTCYILAYRVCAVMEAVSPYRYVLSLTASRLSIWLEEEEGLLTKGRSYIAL